MQKIGEDELDDEKMEFNLCHLLGIDIEAIAYRIAVGDSENEIQKKPTAVSERSDSGTESQINSLEANL